MCWSHGSSNQGRKLKVYFSSLNQFGWKSVGYTFQKSNRYLRKLQRTKIRKVVLIHAWSSMHVTCGAIVVCCHCVIVSYYRYAWIGFRDSKTQWIEKELVPCHQHPDILIWLVCYSLISSTRTNDNIATRIKLCNMQGTASAPWEGEEPSSKLIYFQPLKS